MTGLKQMLKLIKVFTRFSYGNIINSPLFCSCIVRLCRVQCQTVCRHQRLRIFLLSKSTVTLGHHDQFHVKIYSIFRRVLPEELSLHSRNHK